MAGVQPHRRRVARRQAASHEHRRARAQGAGDGAGDHRASEARLRIHLRARSPRGCRLGGHHRGGRVDRATRAGPVPAPAMVARAPSAVQPVAMAQAADIQDYLAPIASCPPPELYRAGRTPAPHRPPRLDERALRRACAGSSRPSPSVSPAPRRPAPADPARLAAARGHRPRARSSYEGIYVHTNGDRTSTVRVTHRTMAARSTSASSRSTAPTRSRSCGTTTRCSATSRTRRPCGSTRASPTVSSRRSWRRAPRPSP